MEKITPTTAELEVLNILWKKEPLTVKEIHELITTNKNVGYTTTLKTMQKMTIKGLLHRKANGKSHLYYATYKQEETRGRLLDRFIDSAFSGSASSLMMQLLGNQKTSKNELNEIKKIIEQMENESNS